MSAKILSPSDCSEQTLPLQVKIANTWWRRFLGLMFQTTLQKQTALWLIPCGGIHTIGMLFTIDVVFLQKNGEISRIAENVRPFRLRFAPKRTYSVLELNAGEAKSLGLKLGQIFKFEID